jgi:CBS domain containing-hemolysin-like protein
MVLQHLGRIPETGDSVEIDLPVSFTPDGEPMPGQRARLTVERMSGLRIDRLRLEQVPVGESGVDDE